MPNIVQAMTVRWDKDEEELQTLFVLNDWLDAVEASAHRRHARAHELGHMVARHCGDKFVMWSENAGAQCAGLDKYTHDKQEHQCECIAALLLVPLWMLRELEGYDTGYVARLLDVPPHLVALRWAIFKRYAR